jgi:toxin ParE1/3/4
MAGVRRSPRAEADLESILDDLDQKDPAVALRYADAFAAKGDLLAKFPEIDRLRPEIGPGLRSTLVRPYVIFYRVEGDVVQILRILHGMRDLPGVMPWRMRRNRSVGLPTGTTLRYSSSRCRGQWSLRSRESERSARMVPPVWQRGQ